MEKALNNIYDKVNNFSSNNHTDLINLFGEIKKVHPEEWLLIVELSKVAERINCKKVINGCSNLLRTFQKKYPKLAHLVTA